ncbi:MAG: NUDIX domain-containing protein [Halobellus sp.]|uniref:NUDIX domain-containing protein n=1 Tax=Halobellus sp. TaxID=1979212 RepID=UPI0035D4817C
MAHVVTCFVRERGQVLLTRRSDAVGTYRGHWAGVSGYVEGDPGSAKRDAWRELREETGLTRDDLAFVRAGESLAVDDEESSFTVHPFLFESDTRRVTPSEELAALEWVDPTVIRSRRTVPRLWETWRRTGPTVETVRSDRTHGSTWIGARALEALRDAAADAEKWATVVAVARDLRDARSGMAAVRNRVNRVMNEASQSLDAVVERAISALDASFDADSEAARTAADQLDADGATRVATLSRSGTVRAALETADLDEVVVTESRPEREGVAVAEWAAETTSATVTVTTEAALPSALATRDVDAVLVGADAVWPGGTVVNKTGSRILGLAAQEQGIPVFVAAARDKVVAAGSDADEAGVFAAEERSPPGSIYDGAADVEVHAPAFETVPGGLVDGVATESGLVHREDVSQIAELHAEHARWDVE